jgi:hypothetical protein
VISFSENFKSNIKGFLIDLDELPNNKVLKKKDYSFDYDLNSKVLHLLTPRGIVFSFKNTSDNNSSNNNGERMS